MRILKGWYDAYRAFRPFTDEEAWMLFKLAAISEAVGWTLLIGGILCERLPVPWHEMPVQLAGRIHGIFFMIYIAAALVLSPSLKWSWFRTIIAGLASVPPYGSLLFELWAARNRRRTDFTNLYGLLYFKRSTASAE
jgi:integral membrane protein